MGNRWSSRFAAPIIAWLPVAVIAARLPAAPIIAVRHQAAAIIAAPRRDHRRAAPGGADQRDATPGVTQIAPRGT